MKKLFTTNKRSIYLLLLLLFSLKLTGQATVNDNHIIIKFDQNSTYTFSASSVGCSFVQSIDCINAELWCVPDVLKIGSDQFTGEQAIADYFASMGGIVEYAEPDWLVEAIGTPNDPSYNQLWGMDKVKAPQAWDIQTGSSDVVVGVIDTGLDWTHPDLIDNIWQNLGEDADGDGSVLEWNGSQWIFDPGDENGVDDDGNGYVDDFVGWDFHNNDNDPYDDHSHGTHVGGTIGAKGNNNTGVCGVNWDVQLMGLKFLGSMGYGYISDALLCIDYAVSNGATISNNSYGGAGYSQAFADVLQVAEQNNHLFVAAAGNNNSNNDFTPVYPAAYPNPNVLTVASTTSSDGRSSFSNFGMTSVDLGAPGSFIYSTIPNNSYASFSGTSMASPHVAGAAALLLSQCNSLTYQEIKAAIMDSADPISALSGICVSGGRLNINAAMQSLPNFNCSLPTNCLTNDSLALVDLYNATNGGNWTNSWNLNQPISTWYGVTLNANGCVSHLNLSDNNLIGTIAGLRDLNLNNLVHLDLSQNSLTDTIPNFSNIPNLEYLSLKSNQLNGNISDFDNLTQLKQLYLSFNQLSGNIPDFSYLPNLEILHLRTNLLTGNVPDFTNLAKLEVFRTEVNYLTGNVPDFTNLPNLVHLNYWTNQLSGTIPDFTNLPNLTHLYLSDNNLTGNIPNFSNLQNLKILELSYNSLSGTIPNFNNLPNVMQFWFRNNQLSGSIPNFNLTPNLVYLMFPNNSLTGSVPPFNFLPNLQNIDLYNNLLTGCFHPDLDAFCGINYYDFSYNSGLPGNGDFDAFCNNGTGSCGIYDCHSQDSLALVSLYNTTDGPNWTNIWDLNQPISTWYGVTLNANGCVSHLNLSDNNLIGTIAGLRDLNLNNLVHLDLSQNSLTDTIPNFSNIPNLEYLSLKSNQLNGNISDFDNLTQLKQLYLSFNQLSGNIPDFSYLPNLEILHLRTNLLTGNVPDFTNLAKLEVFRTEVNYLTGNVPDFTNLPNLVHLNYWTNQLSGTIPDFTNLPNLTHLYLSDNNLTGNIPNFSNLQNLKILELSYNSLSGTIPNFNNLPNVMQFWFRNNQLSGSIPNFNLTPNLVYLMFPNNSLTGSVPPFNFLPNLQNIDLYNNLLTGCFHPDLDAFCGINYYDFSYNSGLPGNGDFDAFCNNGTGSCGNCNTLDLDLGPDVSLSCGDSVTLSTGLANMVLTLWDYEGSLVGNTPSIVANAPGTYVAVVVDNCGNTDIDTIMVNQAGDCVWSGDMNLDNIVNVYDVLFWGLDNGKTGPARSGGNFDWEGQACTDWSTSGPNGVNDKHSDASGNGLVEFNDLNAIELNYGKVHGNANPLNGNTEASFIAASNVNMMNAAGANNGEILIDLVLSEAVSTVHGLAWSIDLGFNGAVGDISFTHNSDWFGTEGVNLKTFYHFKPGNNKIDIAITRTDGQVVSGDGLIGHLTITEDAVLPWEDLDYNISVNITEALRIDNQGNVTYLGNNNNGLVATTGGACPTFHLHNYNNFVDGFYQAENEITSSATIEPTAVVDYRAGNKFTVNPGFTIKPGGVFKATIEDCGQ